MTDLVVDFLVRSTVILAMAWVMTSVLSRASADLRHKIWLAALMGATLSAVPIPVPEPLRIEVGSRGAMAVAAPMLQHPANIWLALWASGAALIFARLLTGLVVLSRCTRRTRGTNRASEGLPVQRFR